MAYTAAEHQQKVPAKMVGGKSHMGHQGNSVMIPVNHFVNKPTKRTSHPAGKSNSKGARKFNHG